MSASIDQSRWEAAYLSEIDRLASITPDRILNTVFFGGGTPSLMEPRVVHSIMDRIRDSWKIANDFEVTLEANPTSAEAGRFQGYRDAGVNRVSLGVQALNDQDLKRLGRLHSVDEALKAVELARTTFDRVSFDLIYARQHQSLVEWEGELRQALSFDPDHLSMYQLTIEPGTAFGARFDAGTLKGLPDDELGADMYDLTQSICDAAGLPAYEVSNHAKSGQESRHNLIYWRGGDYGGIGPGAHGRLTLKGKRHSTQTPLAPDEWLRRVEATNDGGDPAEPLSETDRITELVLMGLRLTEGLPAHRLSDQAFELLWQNAAKMKDEGWLLDNTNDLVVAPKGRPVLNGVLRELLRGY